MKVTKEMVSDYSKNVWSHYNNGELKDEATPKLVLSLYDKEKYVVHIRNLKYYLEKGLKLIKIHRCIKFSQKNGLNLILNSISLKGHRRQQILKKIYLN